MSGFLDWLTPGVGSVIGGVVSAFGQSRANKVTKNYLTEMSNTGYQRAMADMKAAGLNPMLAAKVGPASTPSYQAGNVGGAAVSGFNQTASAMQSLAQADFMSGPQTAKTNAEIQNIFQTNENLKAALRKVNSEIGYIDEQTFIAKLTGNIKNLDNNFFHQVSRLAGFDIGPEGVNSMKQAADVILKGISAGGKAMDFVLERMYPLPLKIRKGK